MTFKKGDGRDCSCKELRARILTLWVVMTCTLSLVGVDWGFFFLSVFISSKIIVNAPLAF